MDVKTITLQYLRQHGYDGLAGDECACKLDGLFPCGGNGGAIDCEPGYLQPQWQANAADCEFMIGQDKPEGAAA